MPVSTKKEYKNIRYAMMILSVFMFVIMLGGILRTVDLYRNGVTVEGIVVEISTEGTFPSQYNIIDYQYEMRPTKTARGELA